MALGFSRFGQYFQEHKSKSKQEQRTQNKAMKSSPNAEPTQNLGKIR